MVNDAATAEYTPTIRSYVVLLYESKSPSNYAILS